MSRFFVRPASDADNEALCELSTVPIEGQISLALERCPDFFAGAKVQNEAVEVNLCCDRSQGDRIAAVFSTGRRQAFVDGVASSVRYLSDVRILPEYQGRRPLRMINDYIVELETAEPSAAIQSVMFSDNDAMRGVVRRPVKLLQRLKYLWFYDLGTYRTSAVSLTSGDRGHECQYSVRRATLDDIPAMQSFFDTEAPTKQLYPRYRFDRLDEPHYEGLSIGDYFLAYDGAELAGITGVWDQQAFKQTRIAGYRGTLRWLRPVVNVISRVATGFSLPPAGTELRYFYLHTIVTRDNSVAVFRDLVEHIYSTYRGRDYLYFLCGLFSHDPLVQVLDSFRSRRDITAQHYQVGIDELERQLSPDMPMYVEAARI
jgi:hypothetical protein